MVTNNGFPAIINFDDLFNAHAAMYLNYSGIETLDWNYLAGTADSISPYHYSLFWIISFLSALFGQNAYLITELSVNPLLYFLLILGFWAFAEKYSITPFIKIFSCLILFVCGLHVSFMDKHSLFNWSYFYFNIFVPDAKLTLYYVVIVASLLLWQNAKYNIALLVFLLLPIFSIVYAPSVFAVCFILIFTHSVLKKKPEVKLFLYLLTVAAIVFMFYRIFNKEQMLGIPAFSLNLAAPFLFSLKTFVYKSEVALIVYFPYLLAIAYSLLFSRSLNFKNVTAAVYFIVISFIFVLDGFI
ncbi:MAG: hypothetical protein ACLQQ4_03130 [Bacteroidia bacterium]